MVVRWIGSPPPTRGKPIVFYIGQGMDRITPAYAGKTNKTSLCFSHRADHPRLRGENHEPGHPLRTVIGSPPPTRGKRIWGICAT